MKRRICNISVLSEGKKGIVIRFWEGLLMRTAMRDR